MAFAASSLKAPIGTEIRDDISDLLTPATGAEPRLLLTERGFLAFKVLDPSDDQQIALVRLMGDLREESRECIYKITLS